MDKDVRHMHSCPICGAIERFPLFATRDRHYGIPGQWTVARCSRCAMVQLDPMPSSRDLMSLYPTNFYAYSDLAATQQGLLGTLKRWLFPTLYVNDPPFSKPGRVLDSGCGTGWSLLKFRDAGWDCVGVEPSVSASKFGRERYGLDVREGTVHGAGFPDAHFDYIRSNHSLEHDPEAEATVQQFRRLIRPDGKLLIGVPNIDSAPGRWFGKYWWYLGAPVHTYNFSLQHLRRLLENNGFEVQTVRYAGNYGGIIGSLQIYMNRDNPKLVSTDGWLINSAPMKVLGQMASAVLNALNLGDAIEIVARPKASK